MRARSAAVVLACLAAFGHATPASAAPTLVLEMRVLHMCPSAHCEVELDIMVCSATLTGFVATEVPVTTAVECYGDGDVGASPGMGLTTTPGPRSTSGGYSNGVDVTLCVAGTATYGVARARISRGPVCGYFYEFPPI